MAFQGIYLTYILTYLFSDILPNLLSDIYSAILSGILSGTYSSILCGICSGILSNISSEILCGRGPAGTTMILGLLFGPGGDHCDRELAVEVRRRKRRRRRRRRRRPADIKSNNPHPGGEKSNNICGLPWWQSNCNVTSFVSTIS